jgi:hypothetical protein
MLGSPARPLPPGVTAVAVALGVTLTALLVGALATAEAQTTAPGYIGAHFDRFEIQSNGKLTNARQLTPGLTNNHVGAAPGTAEPIAPIWASKCSRDKQTARFRRTVELYGRPSDAYFDFTHEIGPKWAGKTPLRTFKVSINGTVIRASKVGKVQPRLVHTDLSAAQLAAFRDGPNNFEIQVEKARSPTGPKNCNSKPANRLAVTFRLFGNIRADLALIEPPPPDQYFKAATPHRTAFATLSLRNKGPSSVPAGGIFEVTVQSADQVYVLGSGQPDPGTGQTQPLGGPFSSCQIEGSKPRFTIKCSLGRIREGDSGSLALAFRKEFTSTAFGEAFSTLGWQVSSMSTPDPVSQNNTRTVQVTWCGDSATSAGCAAAE